MSSTKFIRSWKVRVLITAVVGLIILIGLKAFEEKKDAGTEKPFTLMNASEEDLLPWEDESCYFTKELIEGDAKVILERFLSLDATGTSDEKVSQLMTCPGHIGGPDNQDVILSYKIVDSKLENDKATFKVQYQMAGNLTYGGKRGELNAFFPNGELETVEYTLLSTPYGWRVAVDGVYISKVLAKNITRFPRKNWVPGDKEKYENAVGAKIDIAHLDSCYGYRKKIEESLRDQKPQSRMAKVNDLFDDVKEEFDEDPRGWDPGCVCEKLDGKNNYCGIMTLSKKDNETFIEFYVARLETGEIEFEQVDSWSIPGREKFQCFLLPKKKSKLSNRSNDQWPDIVAMPNDGVEVICPGKSAFSFWIEDEKVKQIWTAD